MKNVTLLVLFYLSLAACSALERASSDSPDGDDRNPEGDTLPPAKGQAPGTCVAADSKSAGSFFASNRDTLFRGFYCVGSDLITQWSDDERDFAKNGEQLLWEFPKHTVPSSVGAPGGETDRGVFRFDAKTSSVSVIDWNGEEQSIDVTLPPVTTTTIDSEDFDFRELCFSRTPLNHLDRSLKISFFRFGAHIFHVVQNCGYVDLIKFSESGEESWRQNLWEASDDEGLFALPKNVLVSVSDSGILTVVEERSKRNEPDLHTVKLTDFDGTVKTTKSLSWRRESVTAWALTQCGNRIYLAGSTEKSINGGSNDKYESDIWLAAVDTTSLERLGETTHHVDKDDTAFDVACDSSGVFLTGEVAKHHVDTGSWDGGGMVFIARFNHDISLGEITVFGLDRLDSGRSIRLGKDNIAVGGVWNGIPNNHLPTEEKWASGFFTILPKMGFSETIEQF